jgi:hypothetical protein
MQICNMLRKKHEEAKEILVRAIVNNNNFLMLNHPIYDEKISLFSLMLIFFSLFGFYCVGNSLIIENIRKIQNFASQLMSKELRT